MKRVILIFLFLLTIIPFSTGQQFRYIRPQEGFYDGEVNSIVQDSTGIMWFATWSGIVRYDGINFESFRPELRNPESLPDKKIKKLFIDSKNNLWAVSATSLCLFNNEKVTFRTINFDRSYNSVINILYVAEANENLLIHAVEGLYILPLNKVNSPEYKAKRVRVFREQELSVYFNYLNTFEEIVFLTSDSNSPLRSEIYIAKVDSNENSQVIRVINSFEVSSRVNAIEYVEPENNIYIATSDGVFVYSLADNDFVKDHYFKGIRVQNVLYTSDHKLYCSTNNTELLYIDLHLGNTGRYASNPNKLGSLPNNNIHVLFEDFSGNLWIGHQGQGVSIKNLFLKEFKTFRRDPLKEHTLNSNTIMCFNGTNREILIGCRTGGLNIMKKKLDDGKETEFSTVTFRQTYRNTDFAGGIWSIAKESDSVFWLGTDAGLKKLLNIKGKWEFDQSDIPVYREVIRNIIIDNNKNIWCGTWNSGLLFIPAMKNNPSRIYYTYSNDPANAESLSDNFVQNITLDSKGRLWVGTLNGLNLLKTNYSNLDLSGKVQPSLQFKRFIAEKPDKNYLNNNEINCVFENFDGKIWIATQGGGINILDTQTDIFSHITAEDGLPSNDIIGILRDEMGILWISTNKGLVAYNQFNERPLFTVFTGSDGIQGEIFMVNSFFKAVDGEMFFGGDNGFSRFYPARIKANNIPPKVALSGLKLANKMVGVNDTIGKRILLDKSLNYLSDIKFPFKNNSFSIGVSSIHFQHPEGNKIAYKLEGYDESWKILPASEQYARFANLPFGKYKFVAKAISSDNVESATSKVLSIEIMPPWYRTWYMSFIFLLLAFSALTGLILIVINRQRLVYQKKIDKMTIENNESKLVFLTNIAHELRTPLSLVIAPIDDIMQNYRSIDPSWKNHLQLVYRNSNYLLKLINQIVDFRKLNAGKLKLSTQETDIVRLIKDVVLNFKYMETRRKVNLNIKVPANKVIMPIDSQKIEEVLYNLLSNAFKHTADNHSITVSLEIAEGNDKSGISLVGRHLRITVFNEGKDICDLDKEKIFERFYKIDENIDGAGIGLSFSKSLIEMHDGTIKVQSVEGGVAFHVLLPFNKYGEDGQADIDNNQEGLEEVIADPYFFEEPEPESSTGNGQKSELKILIVEDNDELRLFLKKVLSRFYICFDASDGQEGWKITKDIIPDIVISDIIMPNKDGYQLCRQIKENLKTCHIPVILLTAKSAGNQIISGYDVGADAYVTKPFDMNLIISQISRLIKNRELIREKYITQNFMVEVAKPNPTKDDEFIINVRSLLEENLSDPEFNVKKLSQHLNISTTQLYRKLKALTSYSPVEFLRVIKLQKAYKLLNVRNNTVKEVCYLSGFNNLSYFIKCFREHFGVTPASFRDKGFSEQFMEDDTNVTLISKLRQREKSDVL